MFTEKQGNVLRIKSDGGTPLNAKQLAFNKLLEKLEKTEGKIKALQKTLDEKLVFTMQTIRPLIAKMEQQDIEMIHLLFDFYRDNKLSKLKSELLAEIIINNIEGIFVYSGNISEAERGELEKILSAVYPGGKEARAQERKEDFELKKEALNNFFSGQGIKINLEGLREDMTEAELEAYMDSIEGETIAANTPQQKPKKKTKKQVEAEQRRKEAEALKDRSLKVIYTDLVKLIHPDRESDETQKAMKEEWMKRLTVAYENRDLKTILEIEAEWIKDERKNLSKTPEETLELYTILLKEQIAGLEQKYALLSHDPRYSPMYQFVNNPGHLKFWKPQQEKLLLEKEFKVNESQLKELRQKGKAARKVIDQIIDNMQEEADDDFFRFN